MLSAPPRNSAVAGEKLYGPLADSLWAGSGKRVPAAVGDRIAKALQSVKGQATSRPVAAKFDASEFIAVRAEDCQGHDRRLRNIRGFQGRP